METASSITFQSQPQLTAQSPSTSLFFSSYLPGGENSTAALEFISGLDDYAGFQGRTLSAMMAASGLASGPTSPSKTMDDAQLQGDLESAPHLSKGVSQRGRPNVRRRAQNREAQRRFRERREQEQKELQQISDDLRTEYQSLCDKHAKTTREASRLLEENDLLRSEVKSLRQRWRMMLVMLQFQDSPESLFSPGAPWNGNRSGNLNGNTAFMDEVRRYSKDLSNEPSPCPS